MLALASCEERQRVLPELNLSSFELGSRSE